MSELLIGAGLVAVVFLVYLFRFTRLRSTRAALVLMRKADAGEPLTEHEKFLLSASASVSPRSTPAKSNRHPVGSDERQIEDIAFEIGKLFPEWTSTGQKVPISLMLDPYVVGFTLPIATMTAMFLGTDIEIARRRSLAIWVHSAACLAGQTPKAVAEMLKSLNLDEEPHRSEVEKGRIDGLAFIKASHGQDSALSETKLKTFQERRLAVADALIAHAAKPSSASPLVPA